MRSKGIHKGKGRQAERERKEEKIERRHKP
jgi:hypothetical protein